MHDDDRDRFNAAFAEAKETGTGYVRRDDGSIRVVISIPKGDLACDDPECVEARTEVVRLRSHLDTLTNFPNLRAALATAERERDELRGQVDEYLNRFDMQDEANVRLERERDELRQRLEIATESCLINIAQHDRTRSELFAMQKERDELRAAVREFADARCTRMPSCDPYDGTHDAECLVTLADQRLMTLTKGPTDAE